MNNIYTKEMHEADELPEVGIRVELCGVVEVSEAQFDIYKHSRVNLWRNGDILNVIAKVVISGDEIVVVQNTRNDQVSSIMARCYKPIDTRTDKEKAIDDIKRKIVNNFTVSPAIVSVIFEEIRCGNIHGIMFTGDKL